MIGEATLVVANLTAIVEIDLNLLSRKNRRKNSREENYSNYNIARYSQLTLAE